MTGMGVLIGLLGGNAESVQIFQEFTGKRIATVNLLNDELVFTFQDGSRMALFDDGQSCCEHRYMVCDDDLRGFAGAVLLGAETKPGPNDPCEWGEHEIEFLDVHTSLGTFQCRCHNEHNGYYGGFLVRAKKL